MAIASIFPATKPSLNLDFANTKFLDPRITFSRASAATYYDGKTVAKAEENLFVRSQEFDTSSWGKVAASVAANATSSPDGSTTSDLLTATAGTGPHRVTQVTGTTASTLYSASVFLKANSSQYVIVALGDGTLGAHWAAATVDIFAGVITQTTNGTGMSSVTTTIESVGSGWYRVKVTAQSAIATLLGLTVVFSDTATPSIPNYALYQFDAAGTESVYLWGAQLEQRSQVTAYTPTTTQPITNYIPVLQTAPAGVPRFDHNPVTGESLGLLVEEQRTNLLFRSEEFSNSIWTKFNTAVEQNVAIAPDGTLTADKLFESSTALVVHGLDQAITTSANTYSAAIYAKAAGRTKFRLSSNSGQSPAAEFDLASNTATPIGSTSSATITPVGNGWFRCTATRTVAGGAEAFQIQLMSAASTAYIGDGYSGIYIWGAQLEAGAFPTSYIKTEASQVTRAADSASMTGANFSSWYRQDEGTLFAEYFQNSSVSGGAGGVFSISNGTLSNRISLYADGASSVVIQPGIFVTAYGAAQVALIPSNGSANSFNKLIGRYKQNDFAASFNGVAVVTDTEGVLPSVDRAFIGQDATGVGQASINSTIKRIAYYPKRLTDAQLQALTA